jgi:trimeric autotransporter adhesin
VKRTLLILLTALTLGPASLRAAEGDENWQEGFTLPPGLDGEVYAMARDGTNLYVGGRFEKAGDVVVNSIARWDGSNWFALDSGIVGTVYALALQGTNLYAGGKFDRAGSALAVNLACWNGIAWQSVGDVKGTDDYSSAAPSFGAQGPKVITLLATTNHLYVGGNFREAGGVAATNIAVLEGTNWSSFGAGLGNLGGQVHALARFRGQLYAGGVFYNSGSLFVTNIARWYGTNWHSVGGGVIGPAFDYWLSETLFNGRVNAMTVQGKRLLVGGQMTRAGKRSVINLASWSGRRWRSIRRGVGTPNYASSVENILVRNSRSIFIGGIFETAGGVRSPNIIRWTTKRWIPMAGGVGGPVRPIAVIGNNVYVGGSFGLAGSISAGYIACWNSVSNSWRALGEGVGNTLIEQAVTLAALGDTVYAAGPIHTAGTNKAHNVAAWTGTNWLVIEPGLAGSATASAVAGSNYYVAGQFYIASVQATNLACWNGSNWSALPTLYDAATNPAVITALAGSGNQLYVAGNFISAGGLPVTNIAAWNGSNWSALADAPAVTLLFGALPMVADAQNLYVHNTVTNNNGSLDEKIYRWDGTNWTLLGAPNGAGHIRSLSLFGSYLYVASVFDQEGDTDTTKLDRWNVNKWEAVNWPFGQLGHVPLLAASERYLYAGGPWGQTASSSPGIARFDGANWAPLGSGQSIRMDLGTWKRSPLRAGACSWRATSRRRAASRRIVSPFGTSLETLNWRCAAFAERLSFAL